MDDDSEESGDEITKLPKQKSPIWNHFEIANATERTATCNVCSKLLSYKSSITNLSKHYVKKHGPIAGMASKLTDDDEGSIEALETYLEDEVTEVEEDPIIDKRKILRNEAWEYFEIHDEVEKIAVCTLCEAQLSYRTSSANLAKHLKRKHYSEIEDNEFLNNLSYDDSKSSDKRKSNCGGGKISAAWEYFTVTDAKRRIATCKLCEKTFSYLTSVSNLMKHINRKHNAGCDDDEYGSENEKQKHRINRSPLWLYFKCIDDEAKISVCLICKMQLSHLSSTSNLKRHLHRKHPGVKLKESIDGQKMFISSNGQLYEIDENPKTEILDVDDGDQTEPMELNAIYLDDYEGNIIETKRNRKPSKRKRVLLSESNETSDDEISFQKRYVKKKTDSLDQFGKYIVSLLKQLPKELSNQLQADFVKQVMTAQLSYESQKVVVTPSNGYAITITEKRKSEEMSNDIENVQYVTTDEGGESNNVTS